MNFYEMMLLMEQESGSIPVPDFPNNFERVLNFVAGGSWSFFVNEREFSPLFSIEKNQSGKWVVFLLAGYRGMSESGRHYKMFVKLVNDQPYKGGANRIESWKKELYDPKGSPSTYYDLEKIVELGQDTDGRKRPSEEEEEEDPNDIYQSLILKLKKIQDDIPKPKFTPEKTVQLPPSRYHARSVDLARQIKDVIINHERQHSF